MRYIAQISGGMVAQVIVGDDADWANEHLGGHWVAVPDGMRAGIGWVWDGEEFTTPAAEEP